MIHALALVVAALALGPGALPAPAPGPEVTVEAGGDVGAGATVDRLPDGAVLVVQAVGFEPWQRGTVAQCLLVMTGPADCVNRFPVHFDGNGAARFQYLVGDRVGSSGCGAGDAPCVVALLGGGSAGVAVTVFGDAAPAPPRISVSPRSGLEEGDTVTVRVAGLPRGTAAAAAQCGSASECDRAATGVAGRDGVATMRLRIRAAEAATVRVTATVAVPPVTTALAFASGPTARYDPLRLGAGLAVAVVLLGVAFALVRTTDWRAPREAATPEMDHAVLDI